MSHAHERSEKICLNCGASLQGRYCHVCGQENVEPKESVGQLIRHFFEDITHFDGKLLNSIKFLNTKPGFLTSEYLAGHRARYLNPIRMYLAISFIFFFVLITFFSPQITTGTSDKKTIAAQDSIQSARFRDSIANAVQVVRTNHQNLKLTWGGSLKEYEAEQDSLPENKRDNRLTHYFKKKAFAASEAVSKGNKTEFLHRFNEKFFHSLPQMLFTILPIFAFILYLLYIRRRKDYNYVAHAIFTVHYYCFVFIGWFLILLFEEVKSVSFIISPLLILVLFAYLYIAMLRFYKQGWLKTLIKYIVLNSVFMVVLVFVSLFYIINSFISAAG